MGPPYQASGFVQRRSRACSGGSSLELFGEHRFSVRAQGPAEGRARFQAKLRYGPKLGLASILIFGEYRDCPDHDLPRLCRTRPALMAGLLFLGFVLRIGAIRLTQGFGLFAIRVNDGERGFNVTCCRRPEHPTRTCTCLASSNRRSERPRKDSDGT
jgi:hypothetical protein